MADVALAEEPLKIAVGRSLDAVAPQRWFLVPISHAVILVALFAMLLVDLGSGAGAVGTRRQGIGPDMIFCRNVIQPGGNGRASQQGSAQEQADQDKVVW